MWESKETGETREQLSNNLVEHTIKDQVYTRDDVGKPEMQERIKAHIQKSSGVIFSLPITIKKR